MSFSSEQRRRLAELADVLIPASGGQLSASQAGIAEEGIDRVLTARPDLAAGLQQLLSSGGTGPAADVVSTWQAGDAPEFGVLAEVAAGAYFMNEQVRAAIGYDGQGPRPIDPRVDYLEDGLLKSVLSRGAIYRPTPGGNG
ncbi:MAG: hypothetical protein KDA75_05520 [Planctomycetaceae bacterium]|nr:hypothetical protein [Planctomycetaceae bacterium]